MDDTVEERLDAVERALTDGETSGGLPDAARMETRLDDLEATVAAVDDRLAELEAAVEALRGFAGGIRAVDEAVERRANAAVARVERLEDELSEAERGPAAVDTDADPAHRAEPGGTGGPAADGDTRQNAGRDGPEARSTGRRSNRTDGHCSRDGAPNGHADRTGTLAETAAAAARHEMTRTGVDGRSAAVTAGHDDDSDDGDDGDDGATLAERVRRLL